MIKASSQYEQDALEFFLKKYGVNTSGITVALARNSKVVGNDDGLTVPKSAKEFVIFIREDHPNADLVRVIAHEAAHVAQLVNGSLTFKKIGGNTNVYWYDEHIDINKVSYRRRPWEIEAFTLEKKYLHEFINKYGNNIKGTKMNKDKIKSFDSFMSEAAPSDMVKFKADMADVEKIFRSVFGARIKTFAINGDDYNEGFLVVTAGVTAVNYLTLGQDMKKLKAKGLVWADDDQNPYSCAMFSNKANLATTMLEFFVDI